MRIRIIPIVLRASLFQLHWFIGIVAGTVLMLIGLSGALLSFESELLDGLNPGVRVIDARTTGSRTSGGVGASAAPLPPPRLLATLPADRAIAQLTLNADPRRAVQVLERPTGREAGTPILYVDPRDGAWLGEARGQAFFDVVERLHRFLLLPRETGKLVTGTLALGLLVLAVSGIYLRWPSQPWRPQAWLGFNARLRGRPLLWSLHAVVATWALPAWLVLTSTGIYWAFDPVRQWVDGLAGTQRAPRVVRQVMPEPPPRPDLTAVWASFEARAPDWQEVRLRLPARVDEAVDLQWLSTSADHPRQRSQLRIALDGRVLAEDRFGDRPAGARAVAVIYPLHVGDYFGLPGRIVMALAALALPLLGVTGWWMYLQRRQRRRTAAAGRRQLEERPGGASIRRPDDPSADPDDRPILVAWAGQTGRAEALALRTASALQRAGNAVNVEVLARLAPEDLSRRRAALLVVSTFGDGQPPDSARRFASAINRDGAPLDGLHYAVLALGNRAYPQFAAFGRHLHRRLAERGGIAVQPLVPACDSDPGAFAAWLGGLGRFGVLTGTGAAAIDPEPSPSWRPWRLENRALLNPLSVGEGLYELHLRPGAGEPLPTWSPGALAEVMPIAAGSGPPRRYSVASIVADGSVQLIVRRQDGGRGLVSGYLTGDCPLQGEIRLRLVANPGFQVVTDRRRCLFIGNGSGLAGLRGLLRERVRLALADNWLVFGERHRDADGLCADELAGWQARGLARIDRVFSRDPGGGYVQDFLRRHRDEVADWLGGDGVVHVCGSLAGMAGGVDAALREMLGADGLETLAGQGRYRRDVY